MAYTIRLSDNAIFVLRDLEDQSARHEIAQAIDGLVLGPEEQGKDLLGELRLAGYRRVLASGGSYSVIYRVIPPDQIQVLGIRRVGGVTSIVERLKRLFLRLVSF